MKPHPGDVIDDKYRLDRVLGEGGMGTVYAATNIVTGKQVAIKWLRPELSRGEEYPARFMREAQVASRIEHPNVVNVFDVGRHDGALFLVMELLQGEPLSALLMRGPVAPQEFIELMMPVLRGVQAAHRMGVVHRDLKPDNIFLCQSAHGELREPKVLDFGISKFSDDSLHAMRPLTREGAVFGTPQYMAPEQVRDAHCADARSDIYALGVIFYRALAGAYPYDAEALPALALRIVEGKAVPLHQHCPNLERNLADVIMRALSPDPEARFQTVATFAAALEAHAGRVPFNAPLRGSERTPASLSDGPPRVSGGLSPTPFKPNPPRRSLRIATLVALLMFALTLPLIAWLSSEAPNVNRAPALPNYVQKPRPLVQTGVAAAGADTPRTDLSVPGPPADGTSAGQLEHGQITEQALPLVKPQSERPRRSARSSDAPAQPAQDPPAQLGSAAPAPPIEPKRAPARMSDRLLESDRNPYLGR